jgi:hypothetical protein
MELDFWKTDFSTLRIPNAGSAGDEATNGNCALGVAMARVK